MHFRICQISWQPTYPFGDRLATSNRRVSTRQSILRVHLSGKATGLKFVFAICFAGTRGELIHRLVSRSSGNEPSAASVSKICPKPIENDDYPVPAAGQEGNMSRAPEPPRGRSP